VSAEGGYAVLRAYFPIAYRNITTSNWAANQWYGSVGTTRHGVKESWALAIVPMNGRSRGGSPSRGFPVEVALDSSLKSRACLC
jgi:hypothetical protein